MNKVDEEYFAVSHLFNGDSFFEKSIISQMDGAKIIEKKETGVGCFSIIEFQLPLPDNQGLNMWDWNFQHQSLPYGGSFIAYYLSPNIIELEVIAHGGVDWPKHLDKSLFIQD